MAKGLAMVTRWTGFSNSAVEPMSNEPAATTTTSPQSGQSRNASPGLYSVGGAGYATSQDVAELQVVLGVQPEKLIGCPVTVKYAMRNPANSMIVCEGWSGLRFGTKGGTTYDSR